MTIRYTCTGCESVLKIKDEKAGTKGKCPKCKQEFVVPQPVPDTEDTSDEEVDIPVDLPMELTPEVPESKEFDPADFLSAQSGPSAGPVSSGSAGGRKPSVAELMRDFESSKKKKDKDPGKDKGKKSGETKGSGSNYETSGSAADALSRAYQQKRESASAPSVSAKDAEAAENRALMMDFIQKRALPGLIITLVLGFSWYWWINYEPYTGPALYEVSGLVKQGGNPLANARLDFGPDPDSPESSRDGFAASATTDETGMYRLSYSAGIFGAPAGKYVVGITSSSGAPLPVSDEEVRRTVSDKDPNEFNFNL